MYAGRCQTTELLQRYFEEQLVPWLFFWKELCVVRMVSQKQLLVPPPQRRRQRQRPGPSWLQLVAENMKQVCEKVGKGERKKVKREIEIAVQTPEHDFGGISKLKMSSWKTDQ